MRTPSSSSSRVLIVAGVASGVGKTTVTLGYVVERALMSYVLLHFASNPALADRFVTACAERSTCRDATRPMN